MIKTIQIAILSYIHHKGWCKKSHRKLEDYVSPDEAWRTECPYVDKIMLLLFPPRIFLGSQDAFEELAKKGVAPGTVFHENK